MKEFYQLGIPIERINTVISLWHSYDRPGKLFIYPAKTAGYDIVEVTDIPLASTIIRQIPETLVKIITKPTNIF